MAAINIGYGTSNSSNVTTSYTQQLQNEVLVTENGVLNITNTNFDTTLPTSNAAEVPQIANHFEKVEIVRNLVDDTFNLRIYRTIDDPAGGFDEYPSLGVNNKVSLGGLQSPLVGQRNSDPSQPSPYWEVNHSLIEDIKFRDTSILGFGTDIYKITNIHPIYKYVISPRFETLPVNVDLSFDQVLHIAVLKKITLSQSPTTTVRIQPHSSSSPSDDSVPHDNDSFRVNLDYNHIYIKPSPINRYHGNEILAKVYIKNDSNITSTYDHNFGQGEMKSTGLGSDKVSVYFKLGESQSEKLENTDAHLLGTIRTLDSLYYDYTNHCVKVGSTSDSVYGDIVPLNFKGDYTREIKLPINAIFTNLNIRFHTHIDSAILDPSDGDVTLRVLNNRNQIARNEIPTKYFDMDDIKIIRQHQPSLRGLEALLNE